MSLSNVFYETTSLSPPIPTLPYFRDSSQGNHFNQQSATIEKANEEATVFLKGLSREVTILPKRSCLFGLTNGLAASFLFKNPIPFLLGLSQCFPIASAQQKVGNEFQVNTYTNNSQWMSSVASFSNGNFVVTWHGPGQSYTCGIFGQLFDGNSSKIGSEFRANTNRINCKWYPSVASFSNDNFVVTWESWGQDGSGYGVYGQLFGGNGAKIGNEFQVNTYINNSQSDPSVASFDDDNFIVTWESFGQDGSGSGVYGQLFYGNGTQIGNEFQVNTYTNNSQSYPSVASFSDGNFVVTWESEGQDSSNLGIYGQLFYGNGTKFGNEFQANTYTTSDQKFPSVATFSNGNFVITWESRSQRGIHGQLFVGNGTKIGSEFPADTNISSGTQQLSSLASFSNGNFVVTWETTGGSTNEIYGQLFDGNGSKIGNRFQVNTYTNSFQSRSSVASFRGGNFVVTWTSRDQDGSDFGVYGQIFNDFLISSTTSSIGRTRTSVNPSSSRTTVPSVTRQIITGNHRSTHSSTSDPSNRFSWIWFLLGGVGVISCLGLMGYYLFKSRKKKKGGDVHALELGERKQLDDSTENTHYHFTPDFVTKGAGQEPLYARTPDFVTEGAGQEPLYARTPDFV